MRFFPLRRKRSELNGKDIDKAGFLILHDKSHNPEACTRTPAKRAGAGVLGVGAFLGTFHGLELVPAKWRYLIPYTSG